MTSGDAEYQEAEEESQKRFTEGPTRTFISRRGVFLEFAPGHYWYEEVEEENEGRREADEHNHRR